MPGYGTWLGIGEETSYGTAVASSKYLELLDGGENVTLEIEPIEIQSLYRTGVLDKDFKQGRRNVTGNVQFAVPWEGAELLFKQAFGSVTTSQPDATNSPSVYKHDFKIADALLPGLTFEIKRGSDVTQSFQYSGIHINSLEFALASVGDPLRVTADVMGRAVSLITATTPTFPAFEKYVGTQATVTWGGTSKVVSDITITLNNNLSGDFYGLGSTLREKPVRGIIEVTGTFTTEFLDTDEYNDFVNATSRILKLTFDSGTVISGTNAGNYKYTMELTCNHTLLPGYPVNVSGPDRILVSVPFKAYQTSTERELVLTIQNGVTSV